MLYLFFIYLYIKAKIRGYGDKFSTNFCHLNVSVIDVSVLQSFLLILYLFMKKNILPASTFRQLWL